MIVKFPDFHFLLFVVSPVSFGLCACIYIIYYKNMARNHEKARSMLHQWAAVKAGSGESAKRRPNDTRRCDNLQAAEKWRTEVIKEVSIGIANISNPELDLEKAREMNEALNKLMRKKYQWERRIKELGGPDYVRASNAQNRRGGGKTQYFGAAKNLPEAKAAEKDTVAPSKSKKRSRAELQKRVDGYYLGEEAETGPDGELLLQAERVAETKRVSQLVVEKHNKAGEIAIDQGVEDVLCGRAGLDVPTQDEVATLLLEAKKARLMAAYAM